MSLSEKFRAARIEAGIETPVIEQPKPAIGSQVPIPLWSFPVGNTLSVSLTKGCLQFKYGLDLIKVTVSGTDLNIKKEHDGEISSFSLPTKSFPACVEKCYPC